MAIRKEKKGICGICSAGCWIIADYDEKGRIVHVRPDEGTEMGILCTLGRHAPEIIYSNDRLLYPMRRKGRKGTYDFERISWDEAFATVTNRLKYIKREHGPEAAGIYTGVGTFELSLCDVFQPKDVAVSSASSVLFPFGSPNTMGVGALCYVSYGMIAPHVTCGKMLIDMFNDMDNSDLIVVWGTNPATDLPPVDLKRIMQAKSRGAEVVVIDPRRTMTVKLADAEWLPIRPGTDGALALGMCNVLIQEELFDEQFVKRWSVGFDDFSRYVQHFRPEVVERITGIESRKVAWLARKIAGARGASQLMYTGLEYSNSGVQSIRAALVLWALAGQLDVPGGRCFRVSGNTFPVNRDGLIEAPRGVKGIGQDRFPVYVKYRHEAHPHGLPESVLQGNPYRIRALIIQGASITTSWPDASRWRDTLGGLDFLVCIDRQLTADAAFADILLPATTYFENESYMVYGSLFRIRERMIQPLGEARSDFSIMSELADRLGYGHLYPQSEEELFRYVLKGSGFSYEDVKRAGGMVSIDTEIMQYRKWEKGLLRADGKQGFDTPSGKFEIASSVLEEYGYDPLPVYTEPKEGPLSRPDLAADYPLVFNSGARVRTGFHTQHRGIEGLVKERPEPTVMINYEDARERSIMSGDLARITTPRGSLTMRAIVTEDIVRGTIEANHACGSPVGPAAWRNRNINELTDFDQYDPISGFPVYKCLLCDVAKEESASGDQVIISSGETGEDEIGAAGPGVVKREVYLDHNATTPISAEVREAMIGAMEQYGNPSSVHAAGARSRETVEKARRTIARALNTTARRIIFTGSGSEGNNLALKGTAFAFRGRKSHIVTSCIEHPAVLKTCHWLESFGCSVTYLPVDGDGIVQPETLENSLREDTFLVSIMLANNETGAIQPVKELAAVAKGKDLLFHCDAVQAVGKIPVDVEELGVDLLTVSSHKLHGPKGVGALYIRRGAEPESLISGGGHEFGLRAGTENVIGIAGFGRAAELIPRLLHGMKTVRSHRDRLEKGIQVIVPGCRVNGPRLARLPNTLNVTLQGIRGESLVLALQTRGIYFSSGSACRSGSSEPSYALTAMGLTDEEAHCSLRFSLGVGNSRDDIDTVLSQLEETIRASRNAVHFVPCR